MSLSKQKFRISASFGLKLESTPNYVIALKSFYCDSKHLNANKAAKPRKFLGIKSKEYHFFKWICLAWPRNKFDSDQNGFKGRQKAFKKNIGD